MDREDDKPKFGEQFVLMHLDHDHRKRENIRFLAVCPHVVQNFGCSPPRSMAPIFRSTSNRIEVLSDSGEAKIREQCTVVPIDEDIRLDTCHR